VAGKILVGLVVFPIQDTTQFIVDKATYPPAQAFPPFRFTVLSPAVHRYLRHTGHYRSVNVQ
jgi:hypothetical protein